MLQYLINDIIIKKIIFDSLLLPLPEFEFLGTQLEYPFEPTRRKSNYCH